ncbi:unnamed protein product [Oreochromis niloticus]|nr:unnamed protein product [Mustela putorius furo]
MPEPPQLAPFDAEEQRLYSEPLPDGRTSHPVSKGEASHPSEEAHFCRLYPRSRSFGHYPQLVAIDAVKIYSYCTAETFGADKDVLYQVNLSQQLLVESTDLQECNTVIVFCPINIRVRSDVEAAMSKAPGNKDIILVLMHHTRKTDYSTSDTEWSQIFPNVILHVDVLFHETERGLLRCQKNEQAICQIQQKLQDISKPTKTDREPSPLCRIHHDPVPASAGSDGVSQPLCGVRSLT